MHSPGPRHQESTLVYTAQTNRHRLAGSRRGNRPAPRASAHIKAIVHIYQAARRVLGGTPSPCSILSPAHLAHYVILAQINRSTQASLAHPIRREHDDSRPNHCYYYLAFCPPFLFLFRRLFAEQTSHNHNASHTHTISMVRAARLLIGAREVIINHASRRT
jgi:hypothetical protein